MRLVAIATATTAASTSRATTEARGALRSMVAVMGSPRLWRTVRADATGVGAASGTARWSNRGAPGGVVRGQPRLPKRTGSSTYGANSSRNSSVMREGRPVAASTITKVVEAIVY